MILALIGGSTAGVRKYFNSRYPNAAEQDLLGQIPLALTSKNTCNRNAETERDTTNVQASVICKSDGDAANSIVFTKFASTKALDSHYRASVAAAGIGQNSGNCLNAGRAEGAYTGESGQTSGRTVCYQERGSSFVTWTDDRVRTLAQATRVDPDYMKLRDWWAGVVGLPTSAETEAQAQAKKQIEDAQKQADDAKRQAEADRKQQADANQKQIDDVRRQAEDDRRQQAQAQQPDRGGGNQNGRRNHRNSRQQNRDDGSANAGQGGGSTNGSQNDGSANAGGGGQDLQQQINDAVRRALQQQGNTGGQGRQQQIEDSVRKSIQRHGNSGGQDIQQLINDAIKQALQQAGQGRR